MAYVRKDKRSKRTKFKRQFFYNIFKAKIKNSTKYFNTSKDVYSTFVVFQLFMSFLPLAFDFISFNLSLNRDAHFLHERAKPFSINQIFWVLSTKSVWKPFENQNLNLHIWKHSKKISENFYIIFLILKVGSILTKLSVIEYFT